MPALDPLPPAAQTVTASELVRRFGDGQRRAAQAPVYILHHRRPQFVLASVEFMQALAGRPREGGAVRLTQLLDALPDPVMLVDRTGGIVAAGRAARLCFGEAATAGGRLDAALSAEAAAFLGAIVARVAASGIREQAELPEPATDRRLELTIEPHPAGALIAARPAGLADARDAALAQRDAILAAASALPDVAVAMIGPRGHLTGPVESLEQLAARGPGALAGVRAVSLFAPASQAAVGDAIEAVFIAGRPLHIAAELATQAAGALPVDVGLAPLRHGLTVTGVAAILAKRG